jgi:alkylated DNA repair dioxygenase AlkB
VLTIRAAARAVITHLDDDCWHLHIPGWLEAPADITSLLCAELPWRQEQLRLYGEWINQPRQTAVAGISYSPASRYLSRNPDAPWTPRVAQLRDLVGMVVPDWQPTGMIANLYRDGNDSISWHADDESALGTNPIVASLSFGNARPFRFRRAGGGPMTHEVTLEHGDLLVMAGATQSRFQHSIPKSRVINSPRLSLTFRKY